MLRRAFVIFMCLATLPAFCQSARKYQVATIMAVKPHPGSGNDVSDVVSYDVSLKVGNTMYEVLYTPPLGTSDPKYSTGRELLVLVGDKTITYNDILGYSHDAPIMSRKSPAEGRTAK